MGILFSFVSMLGFASNMFLVRAAMPRIDTSLGFVILLTINTLFATLVFAVELLIRETPFAIQWKAFGFYVLSGVIGIFLGRRMMIDAIQTLGPARSSVLHTVTPITTAIAAWAIADERLGAFEIVVMIVVIAGLYLLQPRVVATTSAPGLTRQVMWRGLAVAFACIAGFGIGNALRGLATQTWVEPAFGSIAGSGAALLCQLAIQRDRWSLPRQIAAADPRGVWLFVASGIVTVTASMFNTAAMARVEISIVMLVTYSTPLVVFPISLFVLKNKESLSGRNLIGAAMALTGLVMIAIR